MKNKIIILGLFLATLLLVLFWPLKLSEENPKYFFYDRHGELLFSEKPFSGENNQEVPEFFKKSLIAVEDEDFYQHFGVDFSSILRAIKQNFISGEIVSGASTIPMQLARMEFLSKNSRDFTYKIEQIFYAIKLDLQFSKDDILKKYLERVNFGSGAIGLSAASNRYFSKNPANLSIGESAMLIGIIPNPAKFNPISFQDSAEKRRNLVLRILANKKIISEKEKNFWISEKVKLNPSSGSEIHAPHFVFFVRDFLDSLGISRDFDGRELHVYTTIDQKIYSKILNIAKEEINDNSRRNNAHNSAVVAIDLEKNELVSMMGSVDFFDIDIDGSVNMSTAKRSSGSTLKPFLYAEALEQGFSPADELKDELVSFPTKEGRYSPRNFNIDSENGRVRFREALANSYNLAAVNLLNKIGVQLFLKTLTQVGLEIGTKEDLGLASILGAGEVSLFNLTTAFAVFPRKGFFKKPKFIIKITDENGDLVKNSKDLFTEDESKVPRIFSVNTSEWIIDTLSDKVARWRNFSRGNVLEVDRPVAVKTGTSQEFKDNWVVGFSRDLALGVWVGNARGAPLHTSSGVEGAGLIWNRVFRLLHNNLPEREFEFTGNREHVNLCRRPYEQYNCSEKINEFLTSLEISELKKLDYPKIEISFPNNGDIFHRNSEINFQLRNKTNEKNIKYFFNGKVVSNYLKNIPIGRHEIFAEFQKDGKQERTKSVFIIVE